MASGARGPRRRTITSSSSPRATTPSSTLKRCSFYWGWSPRCSCESIPNRCAANTASQQPPDAYGAISDKPLPRPLSQKGTECLFHREGEGRAPLSVSERGAGGLGPPHTQSPLYAQQLHLELLVGGQG